MTDAAWLAIWVLVLATGVSALVLLHSFGLPTTYARDLLHLGAGVWVFGWLEWESFMTPRALVVVVLVVTALVPVAARHFMMVARFRHSVAAGDERFGGLVWYTLAYAAFTWLGFATAMFPAAAALVALSFGDGVGGLVGRRFGRHRYAVPWGKQKSLEGSMFVALTSSAGAALVAFWFDAHVPPSVLFGIGAVAAVAEALSPRGTDNILVPSAVWLAAELLT